MAQAPVPDPALPIDRILPDIVAALDSHGRAVLQAPPGAGKTTRVPLALLQAGASGRIVMLEPRRLAARTAAERMAQSLGEPVGRRVGFTVRGDRKVSPETRIEVVTEGVLTRRLQRDPGLDGVGTVIFDEFHERALQADLGLALAWEVRGALRPDLRLLVMSATLDAGPVAALLDDAPILTAEGRAWPVETRWRDTPPPPGSQAEAQVADLVAQAVADTEGGVLVFLPGAGEIRRVAAALKGRLPAQCHVMPLYGALPAAEQRRALAPLADGRKVVLATSIAETSLTIPDIQVVVDAGLARRSRFDPGAGMARLVTERVSRAEADQRRGRAGRVGPGVCFRNWTRGGEGALAAFPPAEIEAADLAGLALDLAQWGADPGDLAFLTPPPAPGLAAARDLLHDLGALDGRGRITDHGRAIAALPVHPRLAHLLAMAGRQAADLAALLDGSDLRVGGGTDLDRRLAAIRGAGPDIDPATRARVRETARRLAGAVGRHAPDPGRLTTGEMAALAYPDRIGLRRPGDAPRYLLSGGKGGVLPADDALAGQRLIVATDLDGDRREARIRAAAPITEGALRGLFADRIALHHMCAWSPREGRVRARMQERLGAIALTDRVWRDAPEANVVTALLEGVRALGLDALGGQRCFTRLRARLAAARQVAPNLPAADDAHLLDTLEIWLAPFLSGVTDTAGLARVDAGAALAAGIDHADRQTLDRIAPPHYTTPLGRKVVIDYAAADPEIAVRLQEMFGETRHPVVAGRPLRLTLLSPAERPVQTTMDLPRFWEGSYADVRKDMRAQYPKHPWPDDPTAAAPTLKAKRRR